MLDIVQKNSEKRRGVLSKFFSEHICQGISSSYDFHRTLLNYRLTIMIFGSKTRCTVYRDYRHFRLSTKLVNYNIKPEYLPTNKIGTADGFSSLINA